LDGNRFAETRKKKKKKKKDTLIREKEKSEIYSKTQKRGGAKNVYSKSKQWGTHS